jgi:tetratricopeptide (TPR) repeat protein
MKAFFALLLGLGGSVAPAAAQDIWGTPDPAQPATQPVAPATQPAAPATEPAAQPAPAEAPAPAPQRFETVALEAHTYEARVLLGLRQIVLRDFDGALATFRRAAQLEPSSPAAFCHLGDAQLEKGDLAEARAAYETCARFAGVASDARFTTLALVGQARVLERSKVELKEVRDGWLRARDGAGDERGKKMAGERLAMYDAALAREASYAPVRRRIVEREVIRESQSEAYGDPERGL